MNKRPALRTALLFAAGIAAAEIWNFDLQIVVSAAFALTLTACAGFLLKKDTFLHIALILCIILCGSVRLLMTSTELRHDGHITRLDCFDRPVMLHAWISDIHKLHNGNTRLTLIPVAIKTDSVKYEPVAGKITFTTRKRIKAGYGDEITAEGWLFRPEPPGNPGEPDFQKMLERDGIFARFFQRERDNLLITNASHGNLLSSLVVQPVRETSERIIGTLHRGDNLEFLRAILLGQRSGIDPEIIEEFRDTGILHILAVSGLHVGFLSHIIVVLLSFIAILMPLPKRLRFIAACCIIVIFILLTGARPPVIRSGIFFILFYVGTIAQRNHDQFNLLGATAFILLMISPQELFDAGFQLSFGAVTGIMITSAAIHRISQKRHETGSDQSFGSAYGNSANFLNNSRPGGNSIPRKLLLSIFWLFAVSIGAFFGSAPVSVFHFNMLAPSSVLMSVLFVPAAGLIVTLGFLEIVFGMTIPAAAEALSYLTDLLITWVLQFNSLVSGSVITSFSVGLHEIGWVISCSLVFFLSVMFIRTEIQNRSRIIAASIVIMALVSSWMSKPDRNLRIDFIDVGQGDAALLSFPDGTNWLIDSGGELGTTNAGKLHIIPYLKQRGIRNLDGALLSHANADHFSGFESIFEQVGVNTFYETVQSESYDFTRQFHSVRRRNSIPRRIMVEGNRFGGWQKDWRMYVLMPDEKGLEAEDLNKSSMVLLVYYRGRKILFTGDIGFKEEKRLEKYAEMLDVDILKVAHHGSKYSTSEEFLAMTTPEIAVISAGKRNLHGHPTPETLQRLTDAGCEIFRTDRSGMVSVIITQQGNISIREFQREKKPD